MERRNLKPVIGLEVHVELKTESKMFCSCKAEHFGVSPNTQTCPVCLGLPGSLPFPNRKAIEWTVLVGLALNCQINRFSKFDRKNYFYPDLPKGYQISQYDLPLARNGKWKGENGKWIQIRRVHLEEDTGKLIHTKEGSLVDFNRSGVPLMEIVTEPEVASAAEAKVFLQKLQQLVRYLGVAEADMERGEMRCEPNVNLEIKEKDRVYLTPIVEIKNINSFRFVEKAIDWEIKRQSDEFQNARVEKTAGNKVTRGWDEQKQITVPQREKEEAEDYRYFPEPDIPPIRWTNEQIQQLLVQLPELPEEKRTRFMKDYTLTGNMAEILIETRQKADYYEQVVAVARRNQISAKEIANLIINKRLDYTNLGPEALVQEVIQKKHSVGLSKEEISRTVDEVLKNNQPAVADFKKGKVSTLEFLVGRVVQQTKGAADPNLTREIIVEKLTE